MNRMDDSRWLVQSGRVYGLLVRAYPAGFRHTFGDELEQTFRDSCRATLERSGPVGLAMVWMRTLADWIRSVCEQHVREASGMSGKRWLIRLGAVAALIGGLLGVTLAMQGPNAYGNFGWDGRLAPIVPTLMGVGIAGAIAALRNGLDRRGVWGLYTILVGLLLMGLGFAVEVLWGFIFIGPIVIVPAGAILVGVSVYEDATQPTGWRWFPFALITIGLVGFAIELAEGYIGETTPDRGVQLAELLLSVLWIMLGVGLWKAYRDTPDEPSLAA